MSLTTQSTKETVPEKLTQEIKMPSKIIPLSRVLSSVEYKNMRFVIFDAPTDTNLQQYIDELKQRNVATIVRVCEPTYQKERAIEAGISVIDCPFADGSIPPASIITGFLQLCDDLFPGGLQGAATYNDEKTVLNSIGVHCVAGLGRAPVLVAIALIETGMSALDAIEFIRKRRRGAFNTLQLNYLADTYKRGFKSKNGIKKGAVALFGKRSGSPPGSTINLNGKNESAKTEGGFSLSKMFGGFKKENKKLSTVNSHEVKKFAMAAGDWWSPKGQFEMLHAMNPIRTKFIADSLSPNSQSLRLKSMRILDVGCGGGILSLSLARLGAVVTGIDAASENIKVATENATRDPLISTPTFVDTPIEKLEAEEFDAICALEIIEHVSNPEMFIDHCLKRLKPEGTLFVSTINRTAISYLGTILLAENVLGWVPKGTHDHSKYLSPEEVKNMCKGTRVVKEAGLSYCPIENTWKQSQDFSMNYIVALEKNKI